MSASIDIARYLVHLAYDQPEPDPLTHLRIQKLVYYVQGWALAVLGRPLTDDRIEAWKHGPVARGLYQQLKVTGYHGIRREDLGEPENLGATERELIRSVWQVYGKYSASGLLEKTHAEGPWRDARRGLDASERGDVEITHEALRDFFTRELQKCPTAGTHPGDVYRALEEVEAGPTADHDEVFGRLRGGR